MLYKWNDQASEMWLTFCRDRDIPTDALFTIRFVSEYNKRFHVYYEGTPIKSQVTNNNIPFCSVRYFERVK